MEIKIDNFDFSSLVIKDEIGNVVEYDLREELKVNERNLLKEMLEQPSKYIYWSSLLEKIKYFEESEELQLELLEARLDKEARENLEKPTKDSVEAYIKRVPDYAVARKNIMYWKHISAKVQRIVRAYEQRKDMLQSYGKQIADQKLHGAGAGTRFEDMPSHIAAQSPFQQS